MLRLGQQLLLVTTFLALSACARVRDTNSSLAEVGSNNSRYALSSDEQFVVNIPCKSENDCSGRPIKIHVDVVKANLVHVVDVTLLKKAKEGNIAYNLSENEKSTAQIKEDEAKRNQFQKELNGFQQLPNTPETQAQITDVTNKIKDLDGKIAIEKKLVEERLARNKEYQDTIASMNPKQAAEDLWKDMLPVLKSKGVFRVSADGNVSAKYMRPLNAVFDLLWGNGGVLRMERTDYTNMSPSNVAFRYLWMMFDRNLTCIYSEGENGWGSGSLARDIEKEYCLTGKYTSYGSINPRNYLAWKFELDYIGADGVAVPTQDFEYGFNVADQLKVEGGVIFFRSKIRRPKMRPY